MVLLMFYLFYFNIIASFEHDKLTIWGCFGHLALYLILNKLNTKQVFINRFAFDTGHVKLL